LSTCLITLGLCIWLAIHLNVPARNEAPWDFIRALSSWQKARQRWPWCLFCWPGQFLRKVSWTLLGFFAPELVCNITNTMTDLLSALIDNQRQVAFAAYQQYRNAKTLTEKVKKVLPSNTSPSPNDDPEVCSSRSPEPTITNTSAQNPPDANTSRRHQWTIVHSYFVLMGGYEIVIEPETRDILPRTRVLGEPRQGLRLTAKGFKILAKKFPQLIPDQSRERIEDKSKGDAIAKALVCF